MGLFRLVLLFFLKLLLWEVSVALPGDCACGRNWAKGYRAHACAKVSLKSPFALHRAAGHLDVKVTAVYAAWTPTDPGFSGRPQPIWGQTRLGAWYFQAAIWSTATYPTVGRIVPSHVHGAGQYEGVKQTRSNEV
mgnify:CR=1 FL=1